MDTATTPLTSGTGDDSSGFAARVRSALVWRWGTQIIAQLIAWTSTVMVVRMLEPTDYGLFAMTQVVLTVLAFLNGYGFATSLIQAEHVDRRTIGQVFGLLLLFNGTLAAVQFLSAPLMAAYYREPLVADMLRVQAVIFLTVPFTALPSGLLAKRLEFKAQGKIGLVAAIISALAALSMAWLGFGVWALVYAPISGFVFRAVALTMAAKSFVPPVFDLRGAGSLVRFGGAMAVCQLFWVVQSQSDIFIAGRMLDTHNLGLYAEALFLTLIVTGRFLPPINDVAFPAYSELHRRGQSLAPYFVKTARTVLLVTAPIYFGLAVVAEPAVLTLFGEKWIAMAPFVTGLAVAMPAMALQIVCSPTTNAMGQPKYYLISNGAGAIIFPLAFLIAITSGPMGLVHAWWIGAPLLLALTLRLTLPAIGLSFGHLASQLAPVLFANGAMVAAVLASRMVFRPESPLLDLILHASIGATVYATILWFLWPHIIKETWAMLRRRDASASVPADQTNRSADPSAA